MLNAPFDRTDSGFDTAPMHTCKSKPSIHRHRIYHGPAVLRLPSELLIQTLRQVSTNTLYEWQHVNRSFHRVAVALLWQCPRFHSLQKFTTFAHLCAQQVEPSSYMKRLNLSYPPYLADFITPIHCAFLAEPMRSTLVEINLRNCRNITDAALSQLLVIAAPTLQILDVSYCRLLTDTGGYLIASFCGDHQYLRELRLRGCGLIGDATLVELGKYCAATLECLDISSCPRISDRGIFRFLDKAVRKPRELLSSLKTTQTSYNQRDPLSSLEYDIQMDKEDVGLIIQKKISASLTSGKLREFRFSINQTVSRKLTWLELERILACLLSGHRLSVLEFSIPLPPKNNPSKLYKHLPVHTFQTITSLHIFNAENLHPECISQIGDTVGPNLESLTITPTYHCTDRIATSLLSNLPKIKHLALPYSRVGNTHFISHLIQHCDCAETIETLNLSYNKALLDTSLLQLCQMAASFVRQQMFPKLPLPRLTSLLIEGCKNITFDGIRPVIGAYAFIPRDEERVGGRNELKLGNLTYLDITATSIDTKSWPKFLDQCQELERAFLEVGGDSVPPRRFESVLPEYVGVDAESNDREYVFGGPESDNVWEPREGVRNTDLETAVDDTNFSEPPRVFLLKDSKCSVILRQWQLQCIAKHASTVLGSTM
ncbi:hypothetical protein BDR26DRAFT_879542 [Obelidium mucronatum]|nr:hypothetical protein BDR26DRAFT_879542 [Obelidium mucronatum]